MFIRSLIAAYVASILVACTSFSQTYPFKTYTTADGLAQSAVSSFFQDSRGYMWIGTWGGISRYDGQKFWSFRNSAFRVTSICEDNKKTLWVGTTTGLARLALGDSVFQWTSASEGKLPSDYVVTLLKDAEGNMWVGTDKGLVVFKASGGTILLNSERGLQDDHVSAIREDSTGAILIGSGKGIMRCRWRGSELVGSQELLKGTITGAMIVLRNGDILAGSVGDGTVIRYQNGGWQTVFSSKPLGPSLQVRSLGEDDQNNLWIGTTSGLVLIEGKHATHISGSTGLSNQYIGTIYRDREGVLWFGTEGGALKLANTTFRSYNYSTGLPNDHVISIFRDEKKNCWLGTYKGVAMLDQEGRITTFGLSDGLPHLSVHSFAQGANGSVWIGSWDGLVVHENGKLKAALIRELDHRPVIRLLPARDGAIWCGSHGMIMKLTRDGRVLLALDAKNGIPDAGVSSLFIDRENTLWFGTDSYGGGFYRDGKIVLVGEHDGLPDPWVMSISQDKHGTIWFGTQHGAAFWNGKRFEPIRTPDEEPHNGIVSFVVRDSSQNMWFGTQRGVYEWNDSLIGHLDNYDGLAADPTRSGYVDNEGNLWIGTVGGVSRLEMKTFSRKQVAPPVQIEGLALDDQTQPQLRASLSSNENTLTVHFNSLSFRDERRVEFQWILAGFDAAWQPSQTVRHVRYTHLPWGNYEFIVRARNKQTGWSEPARLAFVIRSPFWGTWWFIALFLFTLVGSLMFIYRRRIRGLEKEKQIQQDFSLRLMASQESERKRIAGELHDSLVQDLLVVKNRTIIGMRKAGEVSAVKNEFKEISSTISRAIDEVRGLAHNLRPYQLDRLGLSKAIESLANTVSESSQVQCIVDVSNLDTFFTPETSIVVYRIVQEGINNILKHSHASKASISSSVSDSEVAIIMHDNGDGFDTDALNNNGSLRGFGLNSIEQRVQMLNGKLTVRSLQGGGTTLQIIIPISKTTR